MEIEVKVVYGPDKRAIGASFIAGSEAYTEDFIKKFSLALYQKEAIFRIGGGKVILDNPAYPGATKKAEIILTPEKFEEIRQIFSPTGPLKGKKIKIDQETHSMTAGFRLIRIV
jgi:hypothetical protein